MTRQVPTQCVRFRSLGYILLGVDQNLFSPWDHGIHPENTDSSNWAGFVAHFDIPDEQLYLDYLSVSHTPPARKRLQRSLSNTRDQLDATLDEVIGDYSLPSLNGVEATDAGMGYWHYENIQLALNYTGALTLCPEPGQHEQDYLELVFEKGCLITCKTISPPLSDDASRIMTEGFSREFDWNNLDNDPEIDPPQQP